MQAKSDYILQVGEAGKSRLDLLQELHGKYTAQFCRTVIPINVNTILDLGCGVGNVTSWFSKNFPKAKVYGVDKSVKQIQLACLRKTDNLQFLTVNMEQCQQLEIKFEVIYMRYTLVHMHNPIAVLHLLKKHLALGGMLIIEEPTMSTAFCYPSDEFYNQSRGLLNRLGKAKGLDFELGKKLQRFLIDAGYKILFRKLVQPLLETSQERSLLSLLMQETASAYLQYELSSEHDLARIIKGLRHIEQSDHYLVGFPRTTQICASL